MAFTSTTNQPPLEAVRRINLAIGQIYMVAMGVYLLEHNMHGRHQSERVSKHEPEVCFFRPRSPFPRRV